MSHDQERKKKNCPVKNYVSITGLGKIADRLRAYPGIKDAVVIVVEIEPGVKELCAYIVLTFFDSLHMIDRVDLRRYLSAHLPSTMIPAYFVILEEFPLTAAGEIDPVILPLPEKPGEEEYVAPRNRVEKNLVRIWAEVLHLDEKFIGIDTDFADLGGHSLSAIRLLGKITNEFGVSLNMKDVLKINTIRGLARLIKKMKG